MSGESCLFCEIAAGRIPAQMVFSSPDVIGFRDINPQAPVHVLVVPRRHFANAGELADKDPALLEKVLKVSVNVAVEQGIAVTGYRLVVNTGADGGQTVNHIHVHVLGGRRLGWPPG